MGRFFHGFVVGYAMNESDLKKRIEELASAPSVWNANAFTVYQGALSVMIALHGESSAQVMSLMREREQISENAKGRRIDKDVGELAEGTIKNLKAEIDAGFVGSLQRTVTGEVLTDFVALSRQALDHDKSDESKNVAAVLGAAAFEDTLRRLSSSHGIPHMEKLADVLNELKDKKILQGAQVGIAGSYLNFRNSALHAQWDRIDRAGVASVLGFVEQLLLSHF